MSLFAGKYRVEQTVFALLLVFSGLLLSYNGPLYRWDRFIYDLLSTSSTRSASDDIVIIAVDEGSLNQLGRWPWPRRIHAALIDKLTGAGAKVIGFDVIFSEPSVSFPEEDNLLAAAIAQSGRVVLPVLNERARIDDPLSLTLPLPVLTKAAAGLGHVDIEIDSDGIARSVYLKAGFGKPSWPAFSLAMLQLSDPDYADNLPGVRNSWLDSSSPDNWVRDYKILIPFAGPAGHFQHISYADFLQPDFDETLVKDKFVLVGITGSGLGDSLPTPVSGESVPMPGVELNANILDALSRDLSIEPLSKNAGLLATFFLVLLPVIFYPRLKPGQALAAAAVFLTLTICLSYFVLKIMHLWFAPAPAFLVLAVSYPLWTWRRLKHTVQQLVKEKERAQVTLHSIGDGVITTDEKGKVRYMNPVAEELTGYKEADARGSLFSVIFSVKDEQRGQELIDIFNQCIEEKRIIHLSQSVRLIDSTENERIVLISAGPILDEVNKLMGVVFGINDITETRNAMERIAFQATHDALTGLPNRILLLERMQYAISQAQRNGVHIAVLFIDLDFFKKVNDQLGHSGGDALLQEVGKRLRSCCRDNDTVARFGGDEFVVLLESLQHQEEALPVVKKILRLLEKPYQVENQDIYLGGSVGISLYPKDGSEADMLLKSADTAMCRAKETGRNNFCFFSKKMDEMIRQQLKLERKLRIALDMDDLQLYYQPQIRLHDGKIVGVEALLRWQDEDKRFISPARFIPVAEECGLIHTIGEWVLHTACNQAKMWQEEGLPVLRMAVNLSVKQFSHGDILELLVKIFKSTRLPPPCLELEITEGLIIENLARTCEILRKFREMGGKVAIDDFGTGYSSLAYLKYLPIDQLKIDASFVHDIATSEENIAVTKAILTMGHGLGHEVLAEGVETWEQLFVLKENQCDIVQGYLLSHPLPAKELAAFVKEHPYVDLSPR